MRGYLQAALHKNFALAVQYLGYALEVLTWGRNEWKDVSKDDRGAIFQDTWVMGVQVLYINQLYQVTISHALPQLSSTPLMP